MSNRFLFMLLPQKNEQEFLLPWKILYQELFSAFA